MIASRPGRLAQERAETRPPLRARTGSTAMPTAPTTR